MGWVVGLLLGLAFIGGIFWAIGKVFEALGKGIEAGGGVITSLLGRKYLNEIPVIPMELQFPDDALPKRDDELNALASYKPNAWIPAIPPRIHFHDAGQDIFRENVEPFIEIDIGGIDQILVFDTVRPYEAAFSVLKESPIYGIPVPTKPSPVVPPPSWTPWAFNVQEPSFTLPLWNGVMSFFNNFVIDAYSNEVSRVIAAKHLRQQLIEKVTKRNEAISSLAQSAQDKYEEAVAHQDSGYAQALSFHAKWSNEFDNEVMVAKDDAKKLYKEATATGPDGLLKRIQLSATSMDLPRYVSTEGTTRFDEETGILIHEHRFPDLNEIEWIKFVSLKSGHTKKQATQKEIKESVSKLYPAISLRLAAELIRLDDDDLVKAIVINGWCEFTEKSTGQRKRAYCSSMFATKDQILGLNLRALDPVEAFLALKGQASRTIEIAPISPIIRLDTTDSRFVEGRDVLSTLEQGENLAAMDWEDFEHLCRELFERAFAANGAEVKVTRASRDQGVDAVIFDPDPLRGGKIVIQAKRYTNTVDVSAVRDLFGSVHNEGAIKGILVTTSQFGPEAYAFANGKPLTLINGNELLGLLDQHGYKFRINLAEAKALIQ